MRKDFDNWKKDGSIVNNHVRLVQYKNKFPLFYVMRQRTIPSVQKDLSSLIHAVPLAVRQVLEVDGNTRKLWTSKKQNT